MSNTNTINEGSYIKIKQAKRGVFAFNKNDTVIGKSFDEYGEWGEGILQGLEHFVEEECVILDVGAYIGSLTVPLAKIAGDKGRVIAFEPLRGTYDLLKTNITLNELHNVDALQMAITDKEEVYRIPELNVNRVQNFSEFTVDNYETGEEVVANCIDNIGLQRCDMIVVDTPNTEAKVVRGAKNTLEHCKPILYVRNNNAEGNPELIQELFDAGYNLWWHIQLCYNPENYFSNPNNIFKVNDNEMAHAYMLGVHKSLTLPLNGLLQVEDVNDNCNKAIMRIQESFVAENSSVVENTEGVMVGK